MTRIPLIICFGDSLTAGYQSPSLGDVTDKGPTPYGRYLQERLGNRATVIVSGNCGEVTSDMVRRFGSDVLAQAPAYVVLLGGTNDLGWQTEPATIARNVQDMCERAKASGIRPVVVTVPSIRADPGATEESHDARAWLRSHISRRQDLNRLLMAYCRANQIPCVDLFAVTSEPGTFMLAARYSNDGLHLTTEGYHRLADLLYDEVFAVILGGAGKKGKGETG